MHVELWGCVFRVQNQCPTNFNPVYIKTLVLFLESYVGIHVLIQKTLKSMIGVSNLPNHIQKEWFLGPTYDENPDEVQKNTTN